MELKSYLSLKADHIIGYLQLTDLCLIKVKHQIRDRGNDEFSVHTAQDYSNMKCMLIYVCPY